MSYTNNESRIWASALNSGVVPAPIQQRILNFGVRTKDYQLLEMLAGYTGELDEGVDVALSEQSRATVLVAWMQREGRTAEALMERISTEKRVTVLATVAAVSDLPEKAYEELAKRSGFKALIALLDNSAVPEAARKLATQRALELLVTGEIRQLHYNVESSLRRAVGQFPSVVASVYEAAGKNIFEPLIDEDRARSGMCETVRDAVDTDFALGQAVDVLQAAAFYAVAANEAQWNADAGVCTLVAATDWIETESPTFEDGQSSKAEVALLKALDVLTKDHRYTSRHGARAVRAGYHNGDSSFLGIVNGLQMTLESARGDLKEVNEQLKTTSGQQLRDVMYDVFTRKDSRAANRVGDTLLENPELTVDDIVYVFRKRMDEPDAARHNRNTWYRTSLWPLVKMAEASDIHKRFLAPLPFAERIAETKRVVELCCEVEAMMSPLDLVKVSYYQECREGMEAVEAFMTAMTDVEVEHLDNWMVHSVMEQISSMRSRGRSEQADRLNELVLHFVENLSVLHLTNPRSAMNEALWQLVFDAIPADNEIAWTKFMAMIESEGPVGAVLRSVKRLCGIQTEVTTEVTGEDDAEEDGGAAQLAMAI